MEIAQHIGLQQLGVQRRHAIDRMAAHAGQVRHAHIALAALIKRARPDEHLQGLAELLLPSQFLNVPPVPEPSTFGLLGLGTIGLAIKSRRRRTAA